MMRSALLIMACWASTLCVGSALAQDPPPAEAAPPPAPVDIRQVQVQVWISETNEAGLRSIGANLNYTRFVDGVQTNGSLQEITSEMLDVGPAAESTTVPAPDTLPIPEANLPPVRNNPPFGPPMRPDLPPPNVSNPRHIQYPAGGGLQATILDSDYGSIDASMRAIEHNADADLISKPELLVANGKTANIHAGTEVPYQKLTYDKGKPILNLAFKPVGVKMNMKPVILSDDLLQLEMTDLEVTDRKYENVGGRQLPFFSTRKQTGIVNVPNGLMLVIGGLDSTIFRESEYRVPILGSLPLVGMPFRGRKRENDTTRLTIFVSPTIVDLRNLDDQGMSALNFWQGESWTHAEEIGEEITNLENQTGF